MYTKGVYMYLICFASEIRETTKGLFGFDDVVT